MKNRNLSGADAGRYAEGAPNARSRAFEHFGSPQGLMAAMYPYMFQDTKFHIDEFEGHELDTNLWESDADNGATWLLEKSYAYCSTGGGLIGNPSISLYGPETLQPSKNCGVEIRYQTSTVDDFRLEAGFINRLSGEPRESIIEDVGAEEAEAGNTGAVFHINTDVDGMAFALSSNAGATVETFSNHGDFVPVADNWYTLRVQSVFDGSAGYKAHYYLWNTNSSRMTLVASGFASISSDTAATTYYRPFFMMKNDANPEIVAKIDYIARWQDR